MNPMARLSRLIIVLTQRSQDPDNEFARSEFYQMSHQAELDRTMKVTWWEMFSKPSYRKRTALAMGFAFIGYAQIHTDSPHG
jgi:hypothetical protein